jgi:hypothetical protein
LLLCVREGLCGRPLGNGIRHTNGIRWGYCVCCVLQNGYILNTATQYEYIRELCQTFVPDQFLYCSTFEMYCSTFENAESRTLSVLY